MAEIKSFSIHGRKFNVNKEDSIDSIITGKIIHDRIESELKKAMAPINMKQIWKSHIDRINAVMMLIPARETEVLNELGRKKILLEQAFNNC